jgi:hypothetical protein
MKPFTAALSCRALPLLPLDPHALPHPPPPPHTPTHPPTHPPPCHRYPAPQITERDAVIADNYNTLQALRRRCQELETHKFVLGYKVSIGGVWREGGDPMGSGLYRKPKEGRL